MYKLRAETIRKINQILALLKQAEGEIHLRGIAKTLNMYPQTVSRIIDNYLSIFVDIRSIEEFGFRAKLIRIKPGKEGVSIGDVMKYIAVKERMKPSR